MLSTKRRIATRHGEVFVADFGERAGIPILLIHGFGESSGVWDPMLDRLTGMRRVIQCDLLGHGDSDKPDIPYDVPGQAHSVLSVLDALALKHVHVVAHSAGGDIAVSMLEQAPHTICSVAFLGTAPHLRFVHKSLAARLMLIPGIGHDMWRMANREMIRGGLKQAFARDDFKVPDIFVTSLRKMTYASYVRCLRQIERYKMQKDLCARMADKNVPTLVIFGKGDRWVDPAAADAWAKEVRSRTVQLHNVGHTHMAEAPDQTAIVIAGFLARIDRLNGNGLSHADEPNTLAP